MTAECIKLLAPSQTFNQSTKFKKIIKSNTFIELWGFVYKSLYMECLQPVDIKCATRMSGNIRFCFVSVNVDVCFRKSSWFCTPMSCFNWRPEQICGIAIEANLVVFDWLAKASSLSNASSVWSWYGSCQNHLIVLLKNTETISWCAALWVREKHAVTQNKQQPAIGS